MAQLNRNRAAKAGHRGYRQMFFLSVVIMSMASLLPTGFATGGGHVSSASMSATTKCHAPFHLLKEIFLKDADFRTMRSYESGNNNALIQLRGGKAIKVVKKKSMLKKGMEVLDQVKPATRVYLLLCLFCTLVHTVGLPAPTLFNIEASKLYQLWRPFTSVSYFGAPSMSMANSLYFLIRYGQTLESESGTGAHAWFLLVQVFLLTGLGLLLGFPFQSQALISATIYASSRMHALEKVPIQFGLVVTSWQLPYCMMVIDCLSQQSASAAWPHLLGILSGHTFHFFTKVWPELGGRAWLKPPAWIVKRLGDKPSSNIAGMDFRNKKKDAEDDESAAGSKGKRGGVLNRSKKSRALGGGGGNNKSRKRSLALNRSSSSSSSKASSKQRKSSSGKGRRLGG